MTPASPALPARPIYDSLQIGRGLAAAAVAAFHMTVSMSALGLGNVWGPVTSYGDLGVRFFFVLSGFIILQAHAADIGQPGRVKPYLLKRFARVYPAYWIYISAAVAGMLVVGSKEFDIGSIADVASTYLLVRFSDVHPPIGAAWTLFHEVLFYALFALLLIKRRLGLAVLAAWVVLMLAFALTPPRGNHEPMRVFAGLINLHFFAGMGAYLLTRHLSQRLAWVLLTASIAVLPFAAVLAGWLERREWSEAVIWSLVFGLLIAACCALERAAGAGWKPPRVLTLLGDASFSIYLLHTHAQTYALRLLAKLGLARALPAEAVWLLAFAISILVGIAGYYLIERPLTVWVRRRLLRRSAAERESIPVGQPAT